MSEKATKPAVERSKEEEEEIEKTFELTVNLRRAFLSHGDKIAPRAVRLVRSIVRRHTHSEDVLLMPELNEVIWSRGKKKTLRKIKLRVVKTTEGVIKVYPSEV